MAKCYKISEKKALKAALKTLKKSKPSSRRVRARKGETLHFGVTFRVGRKRDACGASRLRIIQATVAALISSGIFTVDDIIINLNLHVPKHVYYEAEIIEALEASGIEDPYAHLDYILHQSQFYARPIG